MADRELDESSYRTVANQTWIWAREAYEYYIGELFDDYSFYEQEDALIMEDFERLRIVGMDLELDFWKVARQTIREELFETLHKRLYGSILNKLAEQLEHHGQISIINSKIDRAVRSGWNSNLLEIGFDFDENKLQIVISALDILESSCKMYFHLTFFILDGSLQVVVRSDSRQKYMVFGDDTKWNNPLNGFPLDREKFRLGNRNLGINQWGRRWLKDFLDSYNLYARI